MSEYDNMNAENTTGSGGNVTFADEVIATIAALAASDTKGIAGMSGSKSVSEMLGRKNITKGVKVEVGTEEVAIDIYILVLYGFRIQDVAAEIQQNVRSAVENMTGLRVVEVNVYVQGIEIEKTPEEDNTSLQQTQTATVEEDPSRVK